MPDTALKLDGDVPAAARTIPPRHSAIVRVTHWITTLCFLALLVSGIEIVISHPRFYWGETGSVLIGDDVLLEHDEFIAAEPRHEILRPQHLAQPAGDGAQQLVAAGMTQRIVDLFELVEITGHK